MTTMMSGSSCSPLAVFSILAVAGMCWSCGEPAPGQSRDGIAADSGSATQLQSVSDMPVMATVYADNYFELYVNGEQVAVDPLDFTPHQAVQVSFNLPTDATPVYAILASDFATDSGYEYTSTDRPQLGDGGLIAVFSDGRVTDASWKCHTVSYGPTEASDAAGCSADNLDACVVVESAMPRGWTDVDFDDSAWEQATEHSAEAVGWGRRPEYRSGDCCTITDPLTRNNARPSCLAMEESQCLSPEMQSWGDAEFIWGTDLERVNKILCRSQR